MSQLVQPTFKWGNCMNTECLNTRKLKSLNILEAAHCDIPTITLLCMLLATAFHSLSCNTLGSSYPALLPLSWSIVIIQLDSCESLPAGFPTSAFFLPSLSYF